MPKKPYRLIACGILLALAALATDFGDLEILNSFTLGGHSLTDVFISSDAAGTSDATLATAGYVDAHTDTRPLLTDAGSQSGTYAIDGTSGQTIKVTLSGDATLSVTGLANGETCVVWIVNTGGHTITYTSLIPADGTSAIAVLDAEDYPCVIIQQNDNSQTMAHDGGIWRN